MSKKNKKPINPFYVLLIIVGIMFCITASSYGLMAYRDAYPEMASADSPADHPLWVFMDDYGEWLLLGQLACLGVFTFGAIATDQYWINRAAASIDTNSNGPTEGSNP